MNYHQITKKIWEGNLSKLILLGQNYLDFKIRLEQYSDNTTTTNKNADAPEEHE